MVSEYWHTDGRSVWTIRVTILKNKSHLVTFHESILVNLLTFQLTLWIFLCTYPRFVCFRLFFFIIYISTPNITGFSPHPNPLARHPQRSVYSDTTRVSSSTRQPTSPKSLFYRFCKYIWSLGIVVWDHGRGKRKKGKRRNWRPRDHISPYNVSRS